MTAEIETQKSSAIVVVGTVVSMERQQSRAEISMQWMDVVDDYSGEVMKHLPAAGMSMESMRRKVRITIEVLE